MDEKQFNVRSWYAKHLGVSQAVHEPDEDFLMRLLSALVNDPTSSSFDAELLKAGPNLPPNSVGALWLKGNRQPIALTINLSEIVDNDVTYKLGNIDRDKGWSKMRVYELKTRMVGSNIALTMLKEGYSFNETLAALRWAGYACDMQIGEAEGDANLFTIPSLAVSDTTYPKRYFWQLLSPRPELPMKAIPWAVIGEPEVV